MPLFNMQEWQFNLLKAKKRNALPIMTNPGIEIAGNTIMEAVTNGIVHYQAIRSLADSYPALAATMIMDLTVEAEAFGSRIIFSNDEVPSVDGQLLSDIESVEELQVPALHRGRISEFLKAAQLAAGNIRNKPVLGGCIGPFSLAGRLFGLTEIMTSAYLEKEAILMLLEKCTVFLTHYIAALKSTGINGIIMAEPAAGLLDESLCDTLSTAYVKQLVDAFQDDYFLFVLHNCGNTGQVTQSMVRTGAHGLHFGNRMNMKQALLDVPADRLVFGNLDPVGAFKLATPEAMKQQVTSLLTVTRTFPNFILSSGCDTPPGVKINNIKAFYEALDEFNRHMEPSLTLS